MASPESAQGQPRKERFAPKTPVQLDPPKTDPVSPDYLSKCDGTHADYPTLVGIKGKLYDVSKNPAYGPSGTYKVFSGKDSSRALAKSSLKPEDCTAEWEDLSETEKQTLGEWEMYFGKRYNVVGVVGER